MKRKKFVKQLMALGIQRNTAEDYARWCVGHRYGYEEEVHGLRLRLGLLGNPVRPRIYYYETHYPYLYTPKTANGPMSDNMQIVTRAEHAAIHGAGGGG